MAGTCGAKTRSSRPCGQAVLKGAGASLCLFHDPAPKDPVGFHAAFDAFAKEPGKFLDCSGFEFPDFAMSNAWVAGKTALFADARFRGRADFANARFPGGASFGGAEFHGPATFEHAAFAGNAGFVGAAFKGRCSFAAAEFKGFAAFTEAAFEGPIRLRGARFRGGATFNGAAFLARASFRSVQFDGPVTFKEAQFKQETVFRRTCFIRGADFAEARLDGEVSFRAAYLWDPLRFQQAHVGGAVLFEDLRFGRKPLPDRPEGERADAPGAGPSPPPGRGRDGPPPSHLYRIDFSEVSLAGTATFQSLHGGGDDGLHRLDMSLVRLAHTDVSRIRFRNVRWDQPPAWRSPLQAALGLRPRPSARVCDESFLRWVPGVRDHEPLPRRAVEPGHVAEVYRGLARSYEANGHSPEEGAFRRRHMEMVRLQSGANAGPRQSWMRRNLSFLNAYRLLSGYGEDARLVLGWLAVHALLLLGGYGWLARHLFGWVPAPARRTLLDALNVLLPDQLHAPSLTSYAERAVSVLLVALLVVAVRRQVVREG